MDDLSRAIVLVAALAAGGCYAPIPSCSEGAATRELRYESARLQVLANGAFAIAGEGTFASCRDLCAREQDVERVRSCNAPSLEQVARYAGVEVDQWIVRCEVDEVRCHDPAIIKEPSLGSGRRPEGFAPGRRVRGAGGWLASVAALEAASVPAFERLARELAHHGAPRRLVRAASAARRDEVRHARVMSALARRFGASVRSPEVPRLPMRSRSEVLAENAREGCVGETLGAILAHFQALRARDPRVRAAMRRIARDETRHAVLSHRIDAWAASPRAARARAEALAALDPGDIAAKSREEAEVLGLPTASEAARLVELAKRMVWSHEARGDRQ